MAREPWLHRGYLACKKRALGEILPAHTPPARAKPTKINSFLIMNAALLSRLTVLTVVWCRVCAVTCCGPGAMCHALRDSPAQPTLHARYPACTLPLCSYLLHTWESFSTMGIEPDSVPTARLPESEPEQCHTCSLWQVHAGRGRWRRAEGGGRVSPRFPANSARLRLCHLRRGICTRHRPDLSPSRALERANPPRGITHRVFRWQCRERVRLCVVDPHLHAVSSFRLRPDMLSAWFTEPPVGYVGG